MLLTRRWRRELTSRHGFLLVTLIWTSVPLFGTIPFIIERPDMSFAQLYFEMMSCLTTTGATVFTGLDKLPVSLNGWRCFLSWIGGMGSSCCPWPFSRCSAWAARRSSRPRRRAPSRSTA